MEFYKFSTDECLKKFSSSMFGLSNNEVQVRLKDSQSLLISKQKKSNLFLKFLAQLKELMVLILLFSSLISIIIGAIEGSSSEIVDGVIILGIVVMNAIFGVVQEHKTEKAIESLETKGIKILSAEEIYGM